MNKLNISKIIKPTPNTLVASLQTNLSFHDVNPVTKINGSRNACYIAISQIIEMENIKRINKR